MGFRWETRSSLFAVDSCSCKYFRLCWMIRWYNTIGVKERGNFPSDRLFYLRFTFFSFTSRSLPRLELRISVNYIEYLACWEQRIEENIEY